MKPNLTRRIAKLEGFRNEFTTFSDTELEGRLARRLEQIADRGIIPPEGWRDRLADLNSLSELIAWLSQPLQLDPITT